jgi:hypothetical protein
VRKLSTHRGVLRRQASRRLVRVKGVRHGTALLRFKLSRLGAVILS